MAAGTSVLLVLIGAGAAGIAVITKDEPRVVSAMGRVPATTTTTTTSSAAAAVPGALAEQVAEPPGRGKGTVGAGGRISNEANRIATRTPRRVGAGQATPVAAGDAEVPVPPPVAGSGPVVTTQTVSETREVPFLTRLVRDPALPRGHRRVQTEGIPGVETLRYLITYADGVQTGRRLVGSAITREPQDRVIAFGSRRGAGHDRPRECGPELGVCLPLGRSACPAEGGGGSDGALTRGGEPQVSGAIELGVPHELDGIELDPGLVC